MSEHETAAAAPLGEARDAELARLRNWFQAAEESRAKNAALLDRALVDLAAARAEVSRLTADAERLAFLEAWLKGDQGICPPGNHGGSDNAWLFFREDETRDDGRHTWTDEWFGLTLRAAIDAARAATTEST